MHYNIGKTFLAQATANEAKVCIITISPSDVLSKYQGDSERYLKSIFATARNCKHGAIVFFDEFDSIAVARGNLDEGVQSRRLLSELLIQLSLQKQIQQQTQAFTQAAYTASIGCAETAEGAVKVAVSGNNVVVIAATNRLEDLDEAVLRRFDCKIYVGLPDSDTRINLVKKFLGDVDHNLNDSDFQHLSEILFGWTGSDIESLTREAAMIPLRSALAYTNANKEIYMEGMKNLRNVRAINLSDFVSTAEKLIPSSST